MRSAGTVDSASDLGEHDHLCWPYLDGDDFVAQALDFLADGVALGQRIAYVGEAPAGELLEYLRALDGADELIARGAASVLSVGDTYADGSVVGPAVQVAAYTLATASALDEGYRGLRVACEATALVRTPAQRRAFVRYEHLVDRAMRTMPFAALCGYDRTQLGDGAVAELACMHPLAAGDLSPFRLFAPDDADLAIAGEVDTLGAAAFQVALERAVPEVEGDVLLVDASTLGFIDHHGLLALDALGRSSGATVLLRDAPSVAGRLAAVLDLRAVAVEVRA